MNSAERLKELWKIWDVDDDPLTGAQLDELFRIAQSGIGLLAAAEGGEGTPETDALFASFFLPGAKTRPTAGDFDEVLKHARTLEQRCNGLAARVRELEEERCCTCRDGALKQPYSTMPPLQTLPWGTEK